MAGLQGCGNVRAINGSRSEYLMYGLVLGRNGRNLNLKWRFGRSDVSGSYCFRRQIVPISAHRRVGETTSIAPA